MAEVSWSIGCSKEGGDVSIQFCVRLTLTFFCEFSVRIVEFIGFSSANTCTGSTISRQRRIILLKYPTRIVRLITIQYCVNCKLILLKCIRKKRQLNSEEIEKSQKETYERRTLFDNFHHKNRSRTATAFISSLKTKLNCQICIRLKKKFWGFFPLFLGYNPSQSPTNGVSVDIP